MDWNKVAALTAGPLIAEPKGWSCPCGFRGGGRNIRAHRMNCEHWVAWGRQFSRWNAVDPVLMAREEMEGARERHREAVRNFYAVLKQSAESAD